MCGIADPDICGGWGAHPPKNSYNPWRSHIKLSHYHHWVIDWCTFIVRSHRTVCQHQKMLTKRLVWSLYILIGWRLQSTRAGLSLSVVSNHGGSWLATQCWHHSVSLQWDPPIGWRATSSASKVYLAELLRCWLLSLCHLKRRKSLENWRCQYTQSTAGTLTDLWQSQS